MTSKTEATALVFEYLQARYDFEVNAARAFEAAEQQNNVRDALDEIQSAYDKLQSRFCTPRVVELKLRAHFGDPPTVVPSATQVSSVEERGQRVVVTTMELLIEMLGPQVHQYVVEVVGDHPMLADRRAWNDGRWINRVF
jgi:hypothetical protein